MTTPDDRTNIGRLLPESSLHSCRRAVLRHAATAAAACLACAAPSLAGSCPCPGDLDGDGTVGAEDLGALLSAWGRFPGGGGDPCASPDLYEDGAVDGADLGLLLRAWGKCPGAVTGACCVGDICVVSTELECAKLKGYYGGDGSVCGPVGACCFNDGHCEELNQTCCGAYGGFFQGEGTTCASTTCVKVDLDVDTDRDNDIVDDDADDEPGEDAWAKDHGALFIVNCNDSDGFMDEDGLRFNAIHDPVNEDKTIDGRGDEVDITPFVVRGTGALPAGAKVLLKAVKSDIRRIHVFEKREDGTVSFWGGPTEAAEEFQINGFIDPDDPTEMGLEGLYFRFDQPGHKMEFDGEIDLTLEVQTAGGKVLGSDTVRLKVAPYLVLPNTQDAQHIYAKKTTPTFDNTAFLTDLNAALPGLVVEHPTDSQWYQDSHETGYTESPNSYMWVTGHSLHFGGVDDTWPRDLLLDEAGGLYRNPRGPLADSGDFGGNLELLPPTATHKLGRLFFGNTTSDWKRKFLESQEVQPPVYMKPSPMYPADTPIDTKWLAVGHVDETVGFLEVGPHKLVIASPRRAYKILGAPFGGLAGGDPEDELAEDDDLFFGEGISSSAMLATGVFGPNDFVIDVPGIVSGGGNWQYLRIIDVPGDEEHPAIGQMAHVQSTEYFPDEGVTRITIDAVQARFDIDLTTGATGDECAGGPCTLGYTPETSIDTWFVMPPSNFTIVLAEATLFWPTVSAPADAAFGWAPAPGFPEPGALVSVKEVRKNAKLRALNLKCQARLDKIKEAIELGLGADAAAAVIVEVPVIFTTSDPLDAMGEIVPRSCVAWTPGLANVVVAGGKFVFANPGGPKKHADADRFKKAVQTSLGAANCRFVNDWENYHKKMGEVHCGTNALRDPYDFKWWLNQP